MARVVGAFAWVPGPLAELGPALYQSGGWAFYPVRADAALRAAGLAPAEWGPVGPVLAQAGKPPGPAAFVRLEWSREAPVTGPPGAPARVPGGGGCIALSCEVPGSAPGRQPAGVALRAAGPAAPLAAEFAGRKFYCTLVLDGQRAANANAMTPGSVFAPAADLWGACAGAASGTVAGAADWPQCKAMQRARCQPGSAQFASRECRAWRAANSATADSWARDYCGPDGAGRGQPACACLAAGVTGVCGAPCQGAGPDGPVLATRAGVAERNGPGCLLERSVAAAQAHQAAAAQQLEQQRQARAQRLAEVISGARALEGPPQWLWLLVAAFALTSWAAFLWVTRRWARVSLPPDPARRHPAALLAA